MHVNIKFVNLPGPQSSGKYGSIVTTDGTKIMVPADMLGLFRSGMSCEIGTKAQTWGQGTPQESQVIIATSGPQQGYAGSTGPVQGQGVAGGYHGTPDRSSGQRANTGFQPRVYQGGAGAPRATPDEASKWIFITGITGRALGSGKFTISELGVLAKEAARVFDELQKPTPPTRAEPSEPLPGFKPGDPGPTELQ